MPRDNFELAFQDGNCIDLLWTIAGLCDPEPTLMFLTSPHWAILAKEVIKQQPAVLNEITPPNFKVLKVGCLTVVNSGSEDQNAVDEANIQAAQRAHFAAKASALQTGRKDW